MNGTFAGFHDLGPRAHPNDGRLDVVDGVLPGVNAVRAVAGR